MRMWVFLLFAFGMLALQGVLSKSESKWPGLVLPVLAFLFSFLYPLNLAAPPAGGTGGPVFSIFRVIPVWLAGNLPTMIFLAIYLGCRAKRRRSRQLEKMNIQDLG